MDNAVHSQHAVHSTSATVASPLDANAPRLQVPPVSVAAAHAPAASHGTAMTADPPTQPFSFKEPLPPPSTGRPMHWRSSSAPMASSSQMHFQPLPPIQKTIIRLPKLPLQQTLPSTSTSTPKPKSAKQPASARPVPASARDPLQIPTPASTPKPSDAHIPCAPADPAHSHLQPQASSVHRRTTSMPSAVLASGDSGGLDLLYETAFATHPSAASATTAPSAEPAAPAGHTAVAQGGH
ncbi:hypothetical protein BC831DRAFT_74522 [Entophlyctis helioformis]|nr:hypothetical protein BC831DRAFT_74522 [Entophlyctis helioformis]